MDQRLRYLEIKINNSTPAQRLIMLYEALIDHADTVQAEISAQERPNDRARAALSVSRCIDILTELNTTLNHEISPELCGNLSDLYLFFTREISDAFEKCEPERIRAILPLLLDLKKTWIEADQLASVPHAQAA